MKRDILYDLDTIPWHTLHGCYEDGRNIPRYLRELLSTDYKTYDLAYREIFSAISHQGTIYELTIYVVPYLIRLLETDISLEKWKLLGLLACIANGVGYHEVHTYSKEDRQRWQRIYSEKGTTLDAKIAAERTIVQAVKEATLKGVPTFIDTFQQVSGEALRQVCELLAALPQASEQTLPLLKSRYNSVSEPQYILRAIQRLASINDVGWLREVFNNPTTVPAVKFLTIEPLVRLLGENVPKEVLDYLISLVATYIQPDRLYNEAEISGYSVARTVQYCVYQLPTPNNCQLCERALHVATAPNECILFAVDLLDCYLYGRPIGRSYGISRNSVTYHPFSSEYTVQPPLTIEMRRFLTLLIEHHTIWQSESDFLSLYGFPQSREELAQLLL